MKLTRVLLILAFFGVALFGKELVVGMELAYPPFEMTDKDGKPQGVSVDMANELGAYLKMPVRIENIAWDGLIPALKTGKVDLIISSMTITEERKKSIEFSMPYAAISLALLIAVESEVKEFKDLDKKGRKVAVKKGTTGHLYAVEHLKNAEILVFDKESACVLEVTQGKADAFIYDQLTIYNNHVKHKNTTRMNLTPFQKDFEYWGVAIKKDNKELKNSVDKFILEFRGSGGFDKLAQKHLADAKRSFDELGIPFFFSNR